MVGGEGVHEGCLYGGGDWEGTHEGCPYRGGSEEQGGVGDGRSEFLWREGGYACTTVGGVDDPPAAAPGVFEKVDKARESLRVGLPRPPVALHYAIRREHRLETLVRRDDLTDGDEYGVLDGLDSPEPEIAGLFGLAGINLASQVGAPAKWGAGSGMLVTKKS